MTHRGTPGWPSDLGNPMASKGMSPATLTSHRGVPVTTSAPLKAPGSPCVSYIPDPPHSVGKVGYIPAPLLDHKAPTRRPLGPLEYHPAVSTLWPLPCHSPGCVLRAATCQGSGQCPPLQILTLKGGLSPLHAPCPTPCPGMP